MNYIEVDITIKGDKDSFADVYVAELGEIGFESFSDTESGVKAYILKDKYDESAVASVHAQYSELANSELAISEIEQENWNEEWEKNYFDPIVIDNKCVIRSSFHEKNEEVDIEIIIDPRMAFGTGHHATTYLVSSFLLDNPPVDKSLLDMGCGTAVLAILAKKLGSAVTCGIDNDEWAYENALDNLPLNNTLDIEIAHGDAATIGNAKYDIVLANINRNILLNDMGTYIAALNKGGQLIMSGFYTEDVPILLKCASEFGMELVSQKSKDNWAAILLNFKS